MKRLMLIVAGVAFLPIRAETVASIRGDDNGHSKLFEAVVTKTANADATVTYSARLRSTRGLLLLIR